MEFRRHAAAQLLIQRSRFCSSSYRWQISRALRFPMNSRDFEDDAQNISFELNHNKPFGDYGFPKFLTHK